MQKFAKNLEDFGPSNLSYFKQVRMIDLYGPNVWLARSGLQMQQLDLSFQNAQKRLKFQRTPYLKVRAPSIFHTHASHPSKKSQILRLYVFH